jgi:hypothetical protein
MFPAPDIDRQSFFSVRACSYLSLYLQKIAVVYRIHPIHSVFHLHIVHNRAKLLFTWQDCFSQRLLKAARVDE